MRIHPQVEMISGLVGNQYLLINEKELALIDTGLKGNDKKILRAIESIRYKPKQLSQIYITHADADHYSAAAALKSACGSRLYATQVEAEAIRKGKSSRSLHSRSLSLKVLLALLGVFFRAVPAEIDLLISSDDTLPWLGGLQALSTPGHTPGHVSFFSPQTGILFAGDSIQVNRNSTRVWYREDVRRQLLAVTWPSTLLSRHISFALEDYAARVARLSGASPAQASAPAVTPRRRMNEKPSWMSEEQWQFTLAVEQGQIGLGGRHE
jgi:glyoxylase-like metal-dependent hydrolase (beta-lactamase superfamily II)